MKRIDILSIGAVVAAFLVTVLWAVRLYGLDSTPRDFSYFWSAGRIWLNGENPYGPGFGAKAAEVWRDENLHSWGHLPHIWPLTRMLAAVSYETAHALWVGLGAAALAGGTAFVAAAATTGTRARALIFSGLLDYTVLALGSSLTLGIGQFTALAYLGVAALFYAVVRDRAWAMVLALFILTIKPNIGLPLLIFVLARPRWWPAAVIAGVLSVIAGLPAYLIASPLEIFSGFFGSVSGYDSFGSNTPESMTGIRTLLDRWVGIDPSVMWLAILSLPPAVILGRMANPDAGVSGRQAACAIFLSIMLFLVPFHTYDLILVSALVVAVVGRPVFAVALGLGFLALFRVNRLSEMLGILEPGTTFPGSYLASLVLLGLAIASLVLLRVRPGQGTATVSEARQA